MSSTLARLPYTPLQDLLRGRVTARLDWRSSIDEAEVGPEVKALLLLVLSKTRLWKVEKAEVADELLSHFMEGMEAGFEESELIEEFGDPRQAARLLQRAKIRSRPIAWHLFSCLAWLLGILGVFYGGVAVRYYAGRPASLVDPVAAANQQISSQSREDQAWPIYQAFLLASRAEEPDSALGFSAYGKHWPQIAAWIDLHEAAIDLVRRACALPTLGIPAGTGEPATPSVNAGAIGRDGYASPDNPSMPQMRDLRILSDILAFDAKRARELRDGRRVEGDICALQDMAAQEVKGSSSNAGQTFSLQLLARAYDELDRTLIEASRILDDAALLRIAHLIALPQTASDLISFQGERQLFENALDRTFTDDGHGDGHFSPVGWEFSDTKLAWQSTLIDPLVIGRTPVFGLQPASLLMMGAKKDVREEYDRLMDLNDAMIRVPLRDADEDALPQELRRLKNSPILKRRYALVLNLLPPLHRSAEITERNLGQRDGLLVGIALEIYHRRNQRYPAKLAQLVPGALQAIPLDRITGNELKYRLVDGKPLVYSVGADRIDDGGRPPISHGRPDPNAAARWGNDFRIVAGDWVLYPKPRDPTSDMDN